MDDAQSIELPRAGRKSPSAMVGAGMQISTIEDGLRYRWKLYGYSRTNGARRRWCNTVEQSKDRVKLHVLRFDRSQNVAGSC
jgi:hypothetical protein